MKNSIPDVRNSQCIDVFEVASPDSAQTSSTGDPGVSASARVDAPENQVSCSTSRDVIGARRDHAPLEVGTGNAPEQAYGTTPYSCDAAPRKELKTCSLSAVTPAPTGIPESGISLESMADFNDEGDTAWNAQRRNDMARKMQRIAAGVNHYTHDEIEGSVIRAERGELAEVSR